MVRPAQDRFEAGPSLRSGAGQILRGPEVVVPLLRVATTTPSPGITRDLAPWWQRRANAAEYQQRFRLCAAWVACSSDGRRRCLRQGHRDMLWHEPAAREGDRYRLGRGYITCVFDADRVLPRVANFRCPLTSVAIQGNRLLVTTARGGHGRSAYPAPSSPVYDAHRESQEIDVIPRPASVESAPRGSPEGHRQEEAEGNTRTPPSLKPMDARTEARPPKPTHHKRHLHYGKIAGRILGGTATRAVDAGAAPTSPTGSTTAESFQSR